MTTIQMGRRRCDDTCQSAEGRVCTCICGGKNHGQAWRDMNGYIDEPIIIAKPRRLPRHQREQLPLFEGVPAY
jgi:hypothetical protein